MLLLYGAGTAAIALGALLPLHVIKALAMPVNSPEAMKFRARGIAILWSASALVTSAVGAC